MRAGQLVNFAVPAKAASSFVTGTSDLRTFAEALPKIEKLAWDVFGKEGPELDAGKLTLSALTARGVALAKSSDDFLKLADSAIRYVDIDLAIEVARKAKAARPPTGESFRLLAQFLDEKAADLEGGKKTEMLAEAMLNARLAVNQLGQTESSLYTLGAIQVSLGQTAEAYRTFSTAESVPGGRSARVLSELCRIAAVSGRTSDAERWLTQLSKIEGAGWTIYSLAGDLSRADAHTLAGQAYDLSGTVISRSWCLASRQWWLASEQDEALGSARQCIKVLAPSDKTADDLAYAYRLIGTILLGRGVKDEALLNARQAASLSKTDPWVLDLLASALSANDRNTEAVDAAKTALRLSDGKYATMHATLGDAYFKMKNWSDARDAYQRAAELDKSDPSATFNVAVSLYNDKRNNEALFWLEETLRRNPDAELRARTDRLLKIIR
jgi:tetratricopeptide (TPR) repeat protein